MVGHRAMWCDWQACRPELYTQMQEGYKQPQAVDMWVNMLALPGCTQVVAQSHSTQSCSNNGHMWWAGQDSLTPSAHLASPRAAAAAALCRRSCCSPWPLTLLLTGWASSCAGPGVVA